MPYRADSFSDFWRRWHISLSSWLRDYLYIPLGGNRAGTGRTYLNLMIVFLLCGLWHGAGWSARRCPSAP
jgi:alginate O-acetyltransferase complex protein AlgI